MKRISLRLSDEEYEKLAEYAGSKERSLNDILRSCVRELNLVPTRRDWLMQLTSGDKVLCRYGQEGEDPASYPIVHIEGVMEDDCVESGIAVGVQEFPHIFLDSSSILPLHS